MHGRVWSEASLPASRAYCSNAMAARMQTRHELNFTAKSGGRRTQKQSETDDGIDFNRPGIYVEPSEWPRGVPEARDEALTQ